MQNPTIEAAIISGIFLIIGSTLTIAGGFFATYFLQITTSREEKRKLIREKIEEAYTLLGQLRLWATEIRIFILSKREMDESDISIEDIRFWYHTPGINKVKNISIEAPNEKIEAIINLYIPSLRSITREYCDDLSALKTAFVMIDDLNKLIEEGSDEKKLSEKEWLQSIFSQFRQDHTKLQTSLEKLILEY